MHYYLYIITNLVNNKTYIGVHQTRNLNDGYMGSGKNIQAAILKYGKESFKKEIIEFFSSAEEMYDKERQIVNEEFIQRRDNYNLAIGGLGGSIVQNRKAFNQSHSIESREKISRSLSGRILSETHKTNVSKHHWAKRDPEAQRDHAIKATTFIKGVKKTNEIKDKISAGMKGKINNPNGRKFSIVECPHCQKQGNEFAMKRWHFDKCKFNSGDRSSKEECWIVNPEVAVSGSVDHPIVEK